MHRPARWFLLLLLAVAACRSDQALAPNPPASNFREVQTALEQLGYFGPVGVSEVTRFVNGRKEASTRNILLPQEAHEAFLATMRKEPAFARRVFGDVSALTTEVTNPDSLDLTNNSTIDRMQIYTPPSVVGGFTQDIQLRISSQFLDYNTSTSSWYIVPGGHVDSGYVIARNNSAGHYHGSSQAERLLDRRVGRLTRDSPDFTGSLVETWAVPEIAQEINTTYLIRMVGGPRDGVTQYFFSTRPYAVRVQALKRIPSNDLIYARTGGTTIHPEDYNDWGTQELVDSLISAATEYKAATNTVMWVNDASLPFGGKFDIGRRVAGTKTVVDCTDGSPGDCWGGTDKAHSEHRFGTEVDVSPHLGITDPNKATFLQIMQKHFKVHKEGSHLHARVSGSVYYNNF